MIVIGYQGVGKSSLAQRIPKVVDLESSNFRIDGGSQTTGTSHMGTSHLTCRGRDSLS